MIQVPISQNAEWTSSNRQQLWARYQVSTWFFRLAASILCKLARLFNVSVSTVNVSQQWKLVFIRTATKDPAPIPLTQISSAPVLTRVMPNTSFLYTHPSYTAEYSHFQWPVRLLSHWLNYWCCPYIYFSHSQFVPNHKPLSIVIALDFSKTFWRPPFVSSKGLHPGPLSNYYPPDHTHCSVYACVRREIAVNTWW